MTLRICRSMSWMVLLVLATLRMPTAAAEFRSRWQVQNDRVWLGAEYWANPMEDWRLRAGRLECVRSGANRNVHALTRGLGAHAGRLTMSVTTGLRKESGGQGSVGFLVGVRSELGDYRSSLIHGRGLAVGITTGGELFIGSRTKRFSPIPPLDGQGIKLELSATPVQDHYEVQLAVRNAEGREAGRIVAQMLANQLTGNLALLNNRPQTPAKQARATFWFSDWRIDGDKVDSHPDRAWGPILYAMHTLSRNVMKMTAQMPPMGASDSNNVTLEVQRPDGAWRQVGESRIDPLSRTATFRITNWDSRRDTPYRLRYTMQKRTGATREDVFTGVVRRDPVERGTVVVAGFTGNTDSAFPNAKLVSNVAIQNPDVLVFTGDQIYENVGGYGIHRSPVELTVLNYLRKIYLWGWAFRDLMRDRVTLALPDDHDVYQGNIWGQGGRPVPSIREHAQGGYAMPPEFVNAVQRTVTSHHPDPFDPTPIEQGIGVYYGDMVYGGVSFAIIEDRKFKSGPEGKVNTWKGRPDHVKDPNIDPRSLDKPGLTLLGERQLRFLRQWAADWRGAYLKVVVSQTVFCNLANYHGGNRTFLVADLDSNGWPQTGRNKALREMRRGFAFHLAGDQHLASIVHHGVDTWNDAGYSFCVPSIAAGYPRAWRPDKEGRAVQNRPPGGLANTGEYLDGLGNHITVYAVGNPADKNRKPVLERLHDKASGHGLLRLDTRAQTITMECWRLLFDAAHPRTQDQFPGWPKTINLLDNYGRRAAAWLPTITVTGIVDPVIQVRGPSSEEVVYTVRVRGTSFQPKVFEPGTYSVRVGDPDADRWRTITALRSGPKAGNSALSVRFP